nr:hypothetical protein HAGR004_41680 [Bdellovibrio sp. HAGR004]
MGSMQSKKDKLNGLLSKNGEQTVRYEVREKKDKVLSVRLSEKLLNELKKKSKRHSLNTQKLVRLILENYIRDSKI